VAAGNVTVAHSPVLGPDLAVPARPV